MTEKRWEIIDEEFISYTGGTAQLISNGECEIHLWENPKDAQLFCDKLNALNEENEQLKEYNNKLMKQPLLFDVQTIPNTIEIMEANTQLEKENEELKKELFETRKDYILETYADNPVRRDEKLKALEKEFEE